MLGTKQDMTAYGYYIEAALDADHVMQRTGSSIRVIFYDDDHTFFVRGTWSVATTSLLFIHPFYEDSNYIYIACTAQRSGEDRADAVVARWNKNTKTIDSSSNQIGPIRFQDHQNTRAVTMGDNSDAPAGKLRFGYVHTEDAWAGDEDIVYVAYELDTASMTITKLGEELQLSTSRGSIYTVTAGNCSATKYPSRFMFSSLGTSSHQMYSQGVDIDGWSPPLFTRFDSAGPAYDEFGRGKEARALSNRYIANYHWSRGSASSPYDHRITMTRLNQTGNISQSDYVYSISQGGGRGPTGGRLAAADTDVLCWIWASRDLTMLHGIDFLKTAGGTSMTAQGSIYTQVFDPGVSLVTGDGGTYNWDFTGLVNERLDEGDPNASKGKMILSWHDGTKYWWQGVQSNLLPVGGALDTFWIEYPDPAPQQTTSSITLEAGQYYKIRIRGNYAIHSDVYDTYDPDTIIYNAYTHTSGTATAGFDAETLYGYPDTSEAPGHRSFLQFDLGDGNFYHPEPCGGQVTVPSTDHEYEYVVKGKGAKITVRGLNDTNNSDNRGAAKVMIFDATSAEFFTCNPSTSAIPVRFKQRDDGLGIDAQPRVKPGSVPAQTSSAGSSGRIPNHNSYD